MDMRPPCHRHPGRVEPAVPYYAAQGDECALFEHAARQQLPLLIKGPTGCGKTRFVEHMAATAGPALVTVACHDDLSPPTWSAAT
jgi:nitric oxide reductase NorQ protein